MVDSDECVSIFEIKESCKIQEKLNSDQSTDYKSNYNDKNKIISN